MSGAAWGFAEEVLARRPRVVGRPAATADEDAGASGDPHVLLLERIIARTGLDPVPRVQLLPCGPARTAHDTGMGLALAGATRLGRSLRIAADGMPAASTPGHSMDVLPTERDPFVPALHHARLPVAMFDRHATEQPISTCLEATSRAFRLVVIDCAALSASAQALALAPLCSGTVLLVEAGWNRLADIETAARDVTGAGGIVLGTALVALPRGMPRWLTG